MNSKNPDNCDPKWEYGLGVYSSVIAGGRRPKISDATIRKCARLRDGCKCEDQDWAFQSRCLNCNKWIVPISHYKNIEGERTLLSLCPNCSNLKKET